MKFVLPTQNAPQEKCIIGDIKISEKNRVKIETDGMGIFYYDSMEIETPEDNWDLLNEWITFHTFIFNDSTSLNWYEGNDFNSNKLINEGTCSYLVDYSDISKKIDFPNTYSSPLNYKDLYNIYISQTEENKSLVKNYFNSFGVQQVKSLNRNIRNDEFWKILVLFSIIESIIGKPPECKEELVCSIHGKINHNNSNQLDWIKQRLSEIISDADRVDEYLKVIWDIRQKIRHKTVHEGLMPQSVYEPERDGENGDEVVYDWTKTSSEWNKNSIALFSLKNQISHIARYLLLNKIFGLKIFPQIKPIRTKRIVFK